nr:polymorphic toxin type 5 domain-containing protein [Polymorphobacter sp.]
MSVAAAKIAAPTAAAAPIRLGGHHDPAESRAEARATALLSPVIAAPAAPTAPPPSLPTAAGPGLPFSGGQPLGAADRAYFEPRLNRSLADVRIHRGPAATLAARAIGASGFAFGTEIVLTTPDADNAILAHELAHVGEGETRVVRRNDLGQAALTRNLHLREVEALDDAAAKALYDFLHRFTPGKLDDPGFAENYNLVRADQHRRHPAKAAPPQPADQKPATKIPVPIPGIGGTANAATLTSIMQTVVNMEQFASDQANNGLYHIVWEGKNKTISGHGAAKIRADANTRLADGLGKAAHIASSAQGLYDQLSEAGKKSWIASKAVRFIGDIKDPGPVMKVLAAQSAAFAAQANVAVATGDLVRAAVLLANAETAARQADVMVHTYWENIIATGEATITVLEYTAAICGAVAVTIAAVVAAPLVAGIVAGAGATGAGGTALTILGTGLVVGSGNALVRGTTAAAGVGLSGGTSDEALKAADKEGKQGAVEGFLAGAGGSATKALGPALGVGGQASNQFARRAATQAIVNGSSATVDALAHDASLKDALKTGAGAAVLSVPGAAVGGINNRLGREIAAPLTASGTAYAGAIANGATPEQARQAATVAMTTTLVTGRISSGKQADAALQETGRRIGSNARNKVVGAGAAIMIGAADAAPPLRGTGGGTPSAAMLQPASGRPAAAQSAPMASVAVPAVTVPSNAKPATVAEQAVAKPSTTPAAKPTNPAFAAAQPPAPTAAQTPITQPPPAQTPVAQPPAAQAPTSASAAPTSAPAAATSATTVVGSPQPGAGEALVGSSRAQMRRASIRIILSDPHHPLRFLLDASGKFHRQAGLTEHHNLADHPELVQMGHIGSDKLGGAERLMLQGAWENQLNNVSVESPHVGGAVLHQDVISIGGVAVDKRTAKFWESIGWLAPGTVDSAPKIDP